MGIQPVLNGIIIQPAEYQPMKTIKANIKVKDTFIELLYLNQKKGERKTFVNGVIMDSENLFLPENKIKGKSLKIEIID